MAIERETVEYVAHLARLELNSQELELLCRQLQEIVGFIDKLNKLDTLATAPTSHILQLRNVLRPDTAVESLSCAQALENAPQKQEGFFVVPKVID